MGAFSREMPRLLFLCLSVCAILALAQCRVIQQRETVTIEWTVPFAPFELCIAPGSDILFEWGNNNHNVCVVGSQLEWDTCDGISITAPGFGPFLWKSPDIETTTFIVDGAYNHCELGLKIIVITSNTC